MSAGIKETGELLQFCIVFGQSVVKATKDKKVSIFEGIGLVKDLLSGAQAFAGINDIPAELSDLSGVEAAQLLAVVRENLPEFDDGKLQERIDAAQRFAPHLVTFVQEMRGIDPGDVEANTEEAEPA